MQLMDDPLSRIDQSHMSRFATHKGVRATARNRHWSREQFSHISKGRWAKVARNAKPTTESTMTSARCIPTTIRPRPGANGAAMVRAGARLSPRTTESESV